MLRRIISLFDEYQSKENAKHTLRAMRENARQGYFNGARPPFGYRTEALDLPGRKGQKKRLAVEDGEAAIVRRVFALYLHGDQGREVGLLGVARALNWRRHHRYRQLSPRKAPTASRSRPSLSGVRQTGAWAQQI
jgi:DNA invertase Pin-like site-specific DNA recombinase